MNFTSLVNYLQAGLDESLAKFVKGVIASMLVAGIGYATRHIIHASQIALIASLIGGSATSAVVSFFHWLKTTASDTSTVAPDGSTIVG
jgi:hypothetical protein